MPVTSPTRATEVIVTESHTLSRPASRLLLLVGPAILTVALVVQWTSFDAADRSVNGLSNAYLIAIWGLLFGGLLAVVVSVIFFARRGLAQRAIPLAASYVAALTVGALTAWLWVASVN